jgi:hypothetical protein
MQIFFINLKTGEKMEGWWGEHSHRGFGIYDAIVKKTNIRKELLIVRLKNNQTNTILPDSDDPYAPPKDFHYYFSARTDYKDISFTQQANGIWGKELLELCDKNCRTVGAFRKMQTKGSEVANKKVVSDEVLLTLLGIALL